MSTAENITEIAEAYFYGSFDKLFTYARLHPLCDLAYWHDSEIRGHLNDVTLNTKVLVRPCTPQGAALEDLAPSLYLYATLFEIMHFYVTLFVF